MKRHCPHCGKEYNDEIIITTWEDMRFLGKLAERFGFSKYARFFNDVAVNMKYENEDEDE